MARDTLVLRGNLKNEETIKKILTLSQAYAPKVINFLRVAEAQQVLLEVRVAQIAKTKLEELGLSFLVKGNDAEGTSPGFVATPEGELGGPAGFDVTPGIESFSLEDFVPQIGISHFKSGVSLFLRALQTNGLAKVLAEPNLMVKSGEEGKFLAGSRVPIQQVTGVGADQTVSITFEEVGVKLNFAPEVLENGVIRLKIDPAEVSNIDRFISFQGVLAPEIDTRQVSTSVDLKEDESLILAGLLDEVTRKNISKIPVLGDIPILGAIFRSTRDEIETTELAFFITPRLVKPMMPGERPELPGERPLTPEEEAEYKWIPRGTLTGAEKTGE
jgi:pilus assembly protein CpaC